MESAKIIGSVARLVGDLNSAEDVAHDAFLAALEEWRRVGIPPKPGAWLMLTAKRRAVDMIRRRALIERKHEMLTADGDVSGTVPTPDYENVLDTDVHDDLLRLMFTACHPGRHGRPVALPGLLDHPFANLLAKVVDGRGPVLDITRQAVRLLDQEDSI
jgi:predicted RNA polymerase sigma factor